ncbi:MAG TPA: extracellular solute-binding protein [Magnetospirillaceae bacterium]|jgi:microcin C transport system substrate-binding protein
MRPVLAALSAVPFILLALPSASVPVWADEPAPAIGIAIHGDLKYKPGFDHLDYVNPKAPKGGTVRSAAIGTFDSFNPFIVKGTVVAGYGLGNSAGGEYVFETLMVRSADEPASDYGLIAESIEVPTDRSYAIFNLRPEAKFSDGTPITADDVVFSFDILKEKGVPLFRFYYQSVTKAEALDPHKVKFTFAPGDNRELPAIISELPVLSKAYWSKHAFDQTTLEPPVGSGPYKVKSFEQGRTITLERDPNYWGKDLPINRGFYNFDTIRTDYYLDDTVALQAFKAGAFDYRDELSAKQWHTQYDFPAKTDGRVITHVFPTHLPSGMEAFAFNLRRPLFQDVRVRHALIEAYDFEAEDKSLFYGDYKRTKSYFDDSDLASTGLPSADELKLLTPLKGQIPDEVFTQPFTLPVTDGSGNNREQLRKAAALLKDAGWMVKDGKLVDKGGKPFAFEILLDNPAFERIALPYVQSLQRLGITATVRTVDTAQYKSRTNTFDFDMIVGGWGESPSPGNEQREQWGSATADQPGSENVCGVKSPAVDTLIEAVVAAADESALRTAVHALDRVLLWNEYVLPLFHFGAVRIARWDKFGIPDVTPDDGPQITAWWVDAAKEAKVAPSLKN